MAWSVDDFLAHLERQPPRPAYLFLGPETFLRDTCRQALLEKILPAGDRDSGFTHADLEENELAAVIDDARALSLFAPNRLIWVSRAEAALPKGRAAAAEDDDSSAVRGGGGAELLAAYLKDPSPGVTLVIDSSRYEFEGEDKARIERVRKFYACVPDVVEFPRFTPQQARQLAVEMARQAKLRIDASALDLLVECVGASPWNVSQEIEKLRLWVGSARVITAQDIAATAPQARSTTIFALVAALGRNDRAAALDALDTLVRQGEYLPLALSFLAAQMRQALVAMEAGLRTTQQIQGYFSKLGVPMWFSRAEQIRQTLTVFSRHELEDALRKIAAADRDLRDARPDDRVVMEDFVIGLTRGREQLRQRSGI